MLKMAAWREKSLVMPKRGRHKNVLPNAVGDYSSCLREILDFCRYVNNSCRSYFQKCIIPSNGKGLRNKRHCQRDWNEQSKNAKFVVKDKK